MSDQEYDYSYEPKKRSQFLTILCILTFIGSGWGIVSAVRQYLTVDKTVRIAREASFKLKEGKAKDSVRLAGDSVNQSNTRDSTRLSEDSAQVRANRMGQKFVASMSVIVQKENIQKSAIWSLLASLCTLGGALLMWRLRRNGFFLYCLGIVVGIAFPFILYGNNFIAVGLTAFGSFFGLIFIALYALNLKDMKSVETSD